MSRALLQLGKIDEARLGAEVAAKLDASAAYELLTRIEIERPNLTEAHEAAAAAQQADPTLPMPAFVDGIALYQAEKYAEALPHFEDAVRQSAARRVPVADLRYFAGECLARLDRQAEAEAQFRDELKWFPMSVRTRSALAALYLAAKRTDEAAAAAEDLLRAQPTAEAYAAAARVYSGLANRKRASAIRAEARKLFGEQAVRAAEQR
jgi:tetratricopeptide (TPR) repeat protein